MKFNEKIVQVILTGFGIDYGDLSVKTKACPGFASDKDSFTGTVIRVAYFDRGTDEYCKFEFSKITGFIAQLKEKVVAEAVAEAKA